MGVPFTILKDYMVFPSPFLDAIKIKMSFTTVFVLSELDFEIITDFSLTYDQILESIVAFYSLDCF